jgi:transposase InsO family protein
MSYSERGSMSAPGSQSGTREATHSLTAADLAAIDDADSTEMTIRNAAMRRAVEKGHCSRVNFPKLDLDDFYDFECAVFGALVPWQLDFLITASQPPHDAAVQHILRALLLNSLSATDRERLKGVDTFTALYQKLKSESKIRESNRVVGYISDLYGTKQLPGQSLLEFTRSRSDLFAKIARTKHYLPESEAVQTVLRNLRQEFINFADAALNGPADACILSFDKLITKAEQLQSIADNSGGMSASEARLTQLEAQLADTLRLLNSSGHHKNKSGNNSERGQRNVPYPNVSHGKPSRSSKGSGGHPNQRRKRGEKPPSACKHCGGDHWNAECQQTQSSIQNNPPHIVGSCELHFVDAPHSPKGAGDNEVYLDSGATHSFTPHGHLLHEYKELTGVQCGYAGHNAGDRVLGMGTLVLESSNGQQLHLQRVYHIPQLRRTLVGVVKCAKSGVFSHFNRADGSGSVNIGNKLFSHFSVGTNELPRLHVRVVRPPHSAVQAIPTASELVFPSSGVFAPELNGIQLGRIWHQRLCHPGTTAMRSLQRLQLVPSQAQPPTHCEPCIMGKMRHLPRQPPRERTTRPLQLVHTDLVGPLPASLPPCSSRYALILTDDYSRFRVAACSPTKSAVPDVLISELAKLQSAVNKRVQTVASLRSDNGGEYTGAALADVLHRAGIVHEYTPPYTARSNGKAERSNGAIFSRVRTVLQDSGLPHSVWFEVAFAVVYVLNRTPAAGVPGRGIPIEAFTGQRLISLAHLRTIGETCYILTELGPKLAPRAKRGRLVGYASHGRGRTAAYRVLLDGTPPRVVTAVDVIFGDARLPDRASEFTALQAPSTGGAGPTVQRGTRAPPFGGNAADSQGTTGLPGTLGDVFAPVPTLPYGLVPSLPVHTNLPVIPAPAGRAIPGETELPGTGQPRSTSAPIQTTNSPVGPAACADPTPQVPPHMTAASEPAAPAGATPAELPAPAASEPPVPRATPAAPTESAVPAPATPAAPRASSRQRSAPDFYTPIDFRSEHVQFLASHPPVMAAESDMLFDGAIHTICLKYGESIFVGNAKLAAPRTMAEALLRHDADLWRQALAEEYSAFVHKGVIEVQPYRAGLKLVDMRYVLTYKLRPDGTIERRKVRIVAKGFTQRYGIDFYEVWAPTGSLTAYRAMLAHAAEHDQDVELLDIKCAFLNGELDEVIYARPPPGLDDGRVWLLRRAVYGLKQGARAWHVRFRNFLTSLGYRPSAVDPALFCRAAAVGVCILFTHVDDSAGTGPPGEIRSDYEKILKEFEGRRLGEIDGAVFLGIAHRRDRTRRIIYLSQEQLVIALLDRHGLCQECAYLIACFSST